MTKILGHHHTSMLTKNAAQNMQFYTGVLGLRLVKKTVNQDSPDMYHLFYGDEIGSPGTELTFFEMPMAGHTQPGTNAINLIGLLVPSYNSLQYWEQRLTEMNINHGAITTYHGYDALQFQDPDGLNIVLLSNEGLSIPEHWRYWAESSVVEEHHILGMGPIGISVRNLNATAELLQDTFGYVEKASSESTVILQAIEGEQWGEIVLTEQDGTRERAGKGSVHHLAIRVANEQELAHWNNIIRNLGYSTTGVVERFYFTSVYFRDRNNIMFELATDGPGFMVDSDITELGKYLDLPPFLEARRAEIEAVLSPL
ncbi:MAG TPA: ring-cleaving dioxygenase [Candidatus Paenibacillus intestinavium]|nr:ring-cleaving dioxygenase [Candidatus Paenibacillus intestinavium]